VTASASLPVLYAPVSIAGRDLVDGALAEPVPIRAARELGADVVIAIDVAFRPAEEPAPTITLSVDVQRNPKTGLSAGFFLGFSYRHG